MTKSAVTFTRTTETIGALLVMAHPCRWAGSQAPTIVIRPRRPDEEDLVEWEVRCH